MDWNLVMTFDKLFDLYQSALPQMLSGMMVTVQISALSILLGLISGFVFGVLRCQKLGFTYFQKLSEPVIVLFRGTPVFVQLLISYFALPELLGTDLSPYWAGVLTLSVNACAYITEIVRAGMNSVASSQWDACLVLGYTRLQSLRNVIIPQALKTILPSLSGELATLIKESSVLMVIGVPELLKVSRDIASRQLVPMEIYLAAALLYLCMTLTITSLTSLAERKYQWS